MSRHDQLQSRRIDLADVGQVELRDRPIGRQRREQQRRERFRVMHGELAGHTNESVLAPDWKSFVHRHQAMQSLDTASSSTFGWKGFTIQAFAPAARPSAFLSSPASVVSMITGVNL